MRLLLLLSYPILSKYQGKLKLVHCSGELPGLVRLNGVNTWKVIGRDAQTIYSSEQDVPKAENVDMVQLSSLVLNMPSFILIVVSGFFLIFKILEVSSSVSLRRLLRESKSRYKLKLPSLQPIKLYGRQIWHLLIARMKASSCSLFESINIVSKPHVQAPAVDLIRLINQDNSIPIETCFADEQVQADIRTWPWCHKVLLDIQL